jgi:Flp pilus assembly pilin Flp
VLSKSYQFLRRHWRAFAAECRGAVLVEVAFLMPLLTVVLLSGVEIARYALLQQKMSRTAVSLSDLIAQTDSTISLTQVANLYQAADYVMRPFDLTGTGVVILSSIAQTGGNPTVSWQCVGNGGISATSELGTAGGSATLPPNFTMRDGESAIFAEVVYNYAPFVAPNLIGNLTIRHRAIFRPRFGALSSLAPGSVPAGAPTCT